MAVIASSLTQLPTPPTSENIEIAEQPTSSMPALRVSRSGSLARPTRLLPLTEWIGSPSRSTDQLISEAVDGFLGAYGSPPDIVLLSTLRYLSVCSQAGGYETKVASGVIVVYVGYLDGLSDGEARCAFVSRQV